MTPNFPRGFVSWFETYYQIAAMMQNHLDANWDKPVSGEVRETQAMYGSAELSHLCKNWTNIFEEKFKGEEWGVEREWYEELEAFVVEMDENDTYSPSETLSLESNT